MSNGAEAFFEITGAQPPPDYAIVRLLGQGSMAHVFLARNTALKRLVAIKVLRSELAGDDVGCKRFVREAQAAARIQHSSVTSVFAVGELDNSIPFIEMQYVDGSNLSDYLRANGPLDVLTASGLLARLASALAAAHDCNVIHRDVEPANVLIERESGNAYLTDFGIAGILDTGSEAVTKLTREGDRLGNPDYMSPEQLRGDPLTPQADIYGLGLLGYEMLTLNGPFGAAEITDIASAHIRRPAIDLHDAGTGIPLLLSETLKRCVSKKPEHRPSAASLAASFSAIVESRNVEHDRDEADHHVLASFMLELKKRKVYRTAVAYLAFVFVILQVADLVLPALSAPEWVYRMTVILSLAAFPAVLALAWVFDIKQGRLMRAEASSGSDSDRISARQLVVLKTLGLVLSIALSTAMVWLLLMPE